MMIKVAKEVIQTEAKSVEALSSRIDKNFVKAVKIISDCRGRVIVTGMGKTGIIGRKISATLSSTGTPSLWMHSTEAVHGDLGQVTKNDILIVISNSGQNEETLQLLPIVKKIGSTIIAMTGNTSSELAEHSDIVLDVSVKKEACPLGLAPMASTTATLVMGDALAACLIVRKGLGKEDFALYHPGGSLGKELLLKVEDLMRKGERLPKVRENTRVKNVLLSITQSRCGSACVVNARGQLLGIFTDGDLRRHIETDPHLLDKKVKDVMTTTAITISQDKLAVDALRILKEKSIDELPVTDNSNRVVGLLDVQDLLKVGLV